MRAKDCKLLWALVCLTASACGKSPTEETIAPTEPGLEKTLPAPDPEAPAPAPPPAPEPVPTPSPSPESPPAASEGPARWSHLGGTQAWTDATVAVVRANLASFEKAKDREDFCPGYAKSTAGQKLTCWVRLVSAVAELESGFDPKTMYKEANGVYSVGLLQLSAGECANAPTNTALKDPVQNLKCGAKRMADLVARYGYLTSPDNTHGAAAYWSTLRRPYVSHGLKLGKRADVVKATANYRAVSPVAW